MSRFLNFVLGFGMLGALIMAFVAPSIITVLATPPVSFGQQCEPVAAWSMHGLHISEAIGLGLGMLGGTFLAIWHGKRAERVRMAESKIS